MSLTHKIHLSKMSNYAIIMGQRTNNISGISRHFDKDNLKHLFNELVQSMIVSWVEYFCLEGVFYIEDLT